MTVTDQWYCGVDGQQYGPYTWDQLRSMAAEGRIVPQTYVRREIDKQWLSAAQIPGLLARTKGTAKTASTAAPARTTAAASPTASAAAASASSGSKKLIAAKPLTPAAKPVAGTAVPGSAIPVGQPVPAAPGGVAVAPVAVAGSPPVGPPLGFAINTDSPVKSLAAVGDEIEPPKKGGSLVLVGVLGGAAMAVAVVGIALVVWTWTRPPVPDADALAESEPAAAAVESPSEANPEGTKAAEGTSNERAAAASSTAAAKKVLEAQAKWGNVERYSIKLNDVHVKVTGVWLAADAAGTWVEPRLPDASASAGASGSGPPAKYVFVEVRLFNGGPVPRKFRSWNASDSLAAVMADDEGDLLAPVPASATPGVARLSSLRLLPNQAVSDTLVFEAPDDPFETLKLALGHSALTDRSSRHIAFEVPVEVLFRKRGEAAAAGAAQAANDHSPAAAQTGVAAAPLPTQGEAKMPAKAAATNRPPSKEELNKQFEELDKSTPAAAADVPKPDGAKPDGAKPSTAGKSEPPSPAESPFRPVAPAPSAAENPFQPVTPAAPAAPAKPADPPNP